MCWGSRGSGPYHVLGIEGERSVPCVGKRGGAVHTMYRGHRGSGLYHVLGREGERSVLCVGERGGAVCTMCQG